MPAEDTFDSFYLGTRRSLLLQAFALTGDQSAAQSAVRDAYVATWHHWRKVAPLEDREGWVRPVALNLAQRRHAGRIWHRNKGLTDDHRQILDGLSRLTATQRRLLVLVQLAALPLPRAARELGLTLDSAEQLLQTATAQLASHLAVDSTTLRQRLVTLEGGVTGTGLPRATIIRRAGRKRRRVHTAIAVAATAVVAVGSGAFAYAPAGTDDSGPVGLAAAAPQSAGSGDASDPDDPASGSADADASGTASPDPLPEPVTTDGRPDGNDLLDEHQIQRLGPGQRWRVARTHDNTGGDGLNTICQESRFADPDGVSAIVRHFETRDGQRNAVQTVEISRSPEQAAQAFRTTLGWFAGCRLGRLQILEAYEVDNIGDQASVLLLRAWKRPVSTYSVAVARVGDVTTTTVGESVGTGAPPRPEITQSLADSVAMLCSQTDSSDCAKEPSFEVVAPPPSGEKRGLLAVADLPPVGRVAKPWVGTAPRAARQNPAATACDDTDFSNTRESRTRTYLIPEANLPTRFGLSQTYGVFRDSDRAQEFVRKARARVAGCEDRDVATEVVGSQVGSSDRGAKWSSFVLETEVAEDEVVRFRTGFVRAGDKVAQVTFAPTVKDDISPAAFNRMLERAGDRLRQLR
jgi:DNA-directed RNA polymerase specialized sigma24 family protein